MCIVVYVYVFVQFGYEWDYVNRSSSLERFRLNRDEEPYARGGELRSFCLAGIGTRVPCHSRARGVRSTMPGV